MTPSLQITLESHSEFIVMWLQGRIDIESSPYLRSQLLALLRRNSPPKTVVIDLSTIAHIDTSGIATLLQGLKIATLTGIAMPLRGLQGRVFRLFLATGIHSLFGEFADDLSGAKVP